MGTNFEQFLKDFDKFDQQRRDTAHNYHFDIASKQSVLNILEQYELFVAGQWDRHNSYPGDENFRDLFIMTTGLPEEIGESLSHIKKYVRDMTYDRGKITKELGDALFYFTRICLAFGIPLEDVMAANITKLEDRNKRNVIKGSGSDR